MFCSVVAFVVVVCTTKSENRRYLLHSRRCHHHHRRRLPPGWSVAPGSAPLWPEYINSNNTTNCASNCVCEYEDNNNTTYYEEHKFFVHTRMEAIYGTGHKYGHFTKETPTPLPLSAFSVELNKTCTSWSSSLSKAGRYTHPPLFSSTTTPIHLGAYF